MCKRTFLNFDKTFCQIFEVFENFKKVSFFSETIDYGLDHSYLTDLAISYFQSSIIFTEFYQKTAKTPDSW